MSEITPDVIAQIATRLFQGATPAGVGTLPAPAELPVPTAVPSTPPGPIPGPSYAAPVATAHPHFAAPQGMPYTASPPSYGDPVASAGTAATHGISMAPFAALFGSAPAALSSQPLNSASLPAVPSHASPATAPANGGNLPGISGFVQHVRSLSYKSDAGLCDQRGRSRGGAPASPGITGTESSGSSRSFDVAAIRRDFPALHQLVHGRPLVWFDNAATTQKPQSVIDAISQYYAKDNSNIHRAAHTLAARSTDAFEQARQKIQNFLGAASQEEIVLVRGTTEAINLIAQTYGRKFLQPGDEILLTTLEHHANIVPWQLVAKEKGAIIRVVPVNDRGEIMLESYHSLLGPKTRIVALAHANNSLGTLLPVEEMTRAAKRYGARVLIDGAQTVAHVPVNVQELDCDFYVFSGHKIFGPTGIGAAYIKKELQEIMPPWQGGGNMIRNVTFEETTYSDPPAKFEAGTPNIADTVGLGAALDYVQRIGLQNIAKYEHELLEYATEHLARIPGVRLVGTAREKIGVLSFVLPHLRPEEVGKLLDQEGIAVRSGHHCAQPSLRRFGLEATVRPSFALYNTFAEIDHLAAVVRRIAGG